jgi:hypothetical protein
MSRRWLCTSLMGGALALAGCPSDPMTGMDMTGGGADMSVDCGQGAQARLPIKHDHDLG